MLGTHTDFSQFAIGFDTRDRARLHALWDEAIHSQQWSHGEMNRRFEAAWAAWNGAPAVAFSGWAAGALAALEFAGVVGQTVLCPSNTFMATPLAARAAGAEVVFVDCNRSDLCASFADFEAKAERIDRARPSSSTSAATSPSRASASPTSAASEGIFLIEDCAHAHGACWDGPATLGDAGV